MHFDTLCTETLDVQSTYQYRVPCTREEGHRGLCAGRLSVSKGIVRVHWLSERNWQRRAGK